jgi:hypothetical protein
MPFTARLNVGCATLRTISIPFEELLFAFDDEDDLAPLEDNSGFAEELLSALLEELVSSPRELEEFEIISELLLDSSLLDESIGAELENSISDELDSASELLDSTGVELDDSSLELLDCELLDRPYLE